MEFNVSVIIPLFNRRGYIRSCINSVLNQTAPIHEIIVIDDGSTDNSYEAIKDYVDDQKVRYFYQSNKGIPLARNAGIAVATGDYLAFIDSDDLWLPTKIEKQIDYLLKNNGIEFVHNDVSLIDLNGEAYNDTSRFRFFVQGNCFDDVLQYCGINMSSVLITKKLIDTIGTFDRRLQGSEDYEFFMRCSLRYPIGFIDEKLTHYRRHPGGASADRIGILLQAIKAVDIFCENINANKQLQVIANKHKGRLFLRIANRCFYENSDKKESRKYFFYSLYHRYFSNESIPLFIELVSPDGLLKNIRWYKTKLISYLDQS